MPININQVRNRVGATGVDGVSGTQGALGTGDDGGTGTRATHGAGVTVAQANRAFAGGNGHDSIFLDYTATGGQGGMSGNGGAGAGAQSSLSQTGGPGLVRYDTVWTETGAGGAGRPGGNGGLATVKFEQLAFNLGEGSNSVTLGGSANGGFGNFGGRGGDGGSAGGNISSQRTIQTGGTTFLELGETVGAAGGLARVGAKGGDGRDGTVSFAGLSFAGAGLAIDLTADALGGRGGGAGDGGNGGSGNVGAAGGNGGKGGAGGAAVAEVTGLTVAATGRLSLAITLEATGGSAGAGGRGGASGIGQETVSDITASQSGETGFSQQTITYAAAGSGGAGGTGGSATARVADATITGSRFGDTVDIRLTATAGAGGSGGTGGPAVDSYILVTPGSVQSTYTQIGTPGGATGRTGIQGNAVLEMSDVSIGLGAGADTLRLSFLPDTTGRKTVVFANNTFDGGAGLDRLELGTGEPGEMGAIVNVNTGTITLRGSSGTSTFQRFETFAGGAGDDLFVNGAGDQTYSGGAGADTFVFRKGIAGDDRITDFTPGDKLRLAGFGPAIDSFAEVQAISSQDAAGVLIQLSPSASVLLENRTLASLTAEDFLFA